MASPLLEAQSSAPGMKSFTLEEAVNYALANYPAVRAAIQSYAAAHEGVGLATLSYLPNVNVLWQENRATRNNVAGVLLPQPIIPNPSGPVIRESNRSFWGSGAGVLFSDEPFDFGYRRAQVRAAQSTEKRAQAEVQLTRLDVAAGVADAAISVLAAEQQVRASQADVDRRTVFARSVHAVVEAHLRPGADASRADAELAAARTQLALAQETQQVRAAALAEVLGLAGTQINISLGPFRQLPPPGNWEPGSLNDHPLAVVQQRRVQEAQSRADVFSHAYYPHVSFQALLASRGTGTNGQGAPLHGTAGLWPGDVTNWGAGFTLTLPVLDITSSQARKRIELANRGREQALFDQTRQTLTGGLAQAQARLEGARHVAENTPFELQASKESEIQARARFQAGLGTMVDVAEAQRLLLQAEIDDALATLNVWRALADLAAAQGNMAPFLDLLKRTPGGP
ncbi:MAG TPA: TolC family protein [Terriglobales bacterium]|nr:TolC family protein [Terriglobales bacterium]